MNSVRSKDISLIYQRCTTLGFKDIGILNSEFVAKTQFLYDYKWKILPGRLFGAGSEVLWGRALPQIGKMRFGSCAGEVAFPRSSISRVSR